jgi:excisionase family DNA binding protein
VPAPPRRTPPTSLGNKLLTVYEVADHFGVHAETIRRWVHAGRFPAPVNPANGRWRFDPADITAFMSQRRQGGVA